MRGEQSPLFPCVKKNKKIFNKTIDKHNRVCYNSINKEREEEVL
jgi:hypothetical protein